MRDLIRKVLKEESNKVIKFNSVDNTQHSSICDKFNVNSIGEILQLLSKENLDYGQKKEISKILKKLNDDEDRLPTKLDTLDTYFHDIQDIVCKK